MSEQNTEEKSPRIVIYSPVDDEVEESVDIDIPAEDDIEASDLLTRTDPEASGRLSVLSVGRRSLMSRMSGLSLDSAIYKYENVFLVTVFLIILLVFVLVGIFIAKIFLCTDCDEIDNFKNVTVAEDLYDDHELIF